MSRNISTAQRIALVALGPLVALAIGVGSVMARGDNDVATVVFHGTATSEGTIAGFPIALDMSALPTEGPMDSTCFPYRYEAEGEARGNKGLTGPFVYLERGLICLWDETSLYYAEHGPLAGSQLLDATFTILADGGPAGDISISDSNPDAYTSGHGVMEPAEAPTWARPFFNQLAKTQGGSPVTYGFFTFSTNGEQFMGYSTPDFGKFVIQLQVTPPAPSASRLAR